MSPTTVATQIQARRDELVVIVERLRRLDQDPTRRLLAGVTLTGRSAHRWSGVEAQLAGVWAAAVALTDRFDALDELRRTSRWRQQGWLVAATELLTEPGIELTGAVIGAPRTSKRRRSPDPLDIGHLLAGMSGCLDEAEAMAARADVSWSSAAPALAASRASLLATVASAQTLHLRIPATVRQTMASLELAETQVSTDPLDVDVDGLDTLHREADARRDELSAAMHERETFDSRHAALIEDLETTRRLLGRVRHRCSDVRCRVVVDSGSDAEIDELDRRLVVLSDDAASLETVAAVDWAATARRAAGVEDRLRTLQQDARTVEDTASSALDERDVLRGRLASYRARAARSDRGEDRQLELRYTAAFRALHRAPVDLASAADLVHAYVDALERVAVQP